MCALKKVFTFLFLLPLFLCGCTKKPPGAEESKPSVLVSVAPYAYFVERISLSTIEPKILIPLGANPHLFELTPKQVEPLCNIDLWFGIGEPIEQKAMPLLKKYNPSLTFVDLSEGIDLLSPEGEHTHEGHETHAEGKDRHIWLSPTSAIIQAKAMASVLSEKFPNQKEIFAAGLEGFIHDLEDLDAKIRAQLAPFKGDAILVSHPAFGYFCKDFDLIQLSVEYEGKDPLPRQIDSLIEQAKQLHVRCALLQVQYNNKGALMLAEKLHIPAYTIDPYSLQYLENLQQLSRFIAHE